MSDIRKATVSVSFTVTYDWSRLSTEILDELAELPRNDAIASDSELLPAVFIADEIALMLEEASSAGLLDRRAFSDLTYTSPSVVFDESADGEENDED